MHLPRRRLCCALAVVLTVSACGPRHQAPVIGPEVQLDYAFPDTSPDRLWSAVNRAAGSADWPVDSVAVERRRLVTGWMPAPAGSTDCGSYRELPGNVEAFEDEEYRVRITVSEGEEQGSRMRIWSDHRAMGWYGERVSDCVTTGRIQDAVRAEIGTALRGASDADS